MKKKVVRTPYGNVSDEEIVIKELTTNDTSRWWYTLSKYAQFTEEQLHNYKHKIDWITYISRMDIKIIDNDILRYVIKKYDTTFSGFWIYISKYHAVDFEFIKENNKNIRFFLLNERLKLKSSELVKLMPKINIGDRCLIFGHTEQFKVTKMMNKTNTRMQIINCKTHEIVNISLRCDGHWKIVGSNDTAFFYLVK